MSHSPLFQQLRHTLSIVHYCQAKKVSTAEGIERIRLLESQRYNRRQFFTRMGKLAVVGGAIGVGSGQLHHTLAAPKPIEAKVAIVGAGFAGLACGYELQRKGIRATLYEANTRVGGRCASLGGAFPGTVTFPGQVVELGGEFIDNLHKVMLGYVREFNLELENLSKQPGEVFYYVNGQRYSESVVVDEFRDFVDRMRDDLRTLSGEPTADNYTEGDRILDFTTLADYLDSRGAGSILKAVIEAAYIGEYGLELNQQSALNLLLYIHADKRSKFKPFGVFRDERYHVIGGNQQIAVELANRLSGQIEFDKELIAARKNSTGQVELTFEDGLSDIFDIVVFAIPFSILRDVDLTGLQLPEEKLFAINNLVYGTNSKLMVGFQGRPWLASGGNGTAYGDLPYLQTVWETNPTNANPNRAVLSDYTGGNLGARLDPQDVQLQTMAFLNNLDQIFPGTLAAATRTNGNQFLAYLENWLFNPLAKGSYICNQPGYFTTIANNEGKPVDNIYFAGEHANSFYDWQGFMEGAAISGLDAADQIVRRFQGNQKQG